MPSSRGSSRPRDQTCISYVSCIGRQVFTTRVTWEAWHPAWHRLKCSKTICWLKAWKNEYADKALELVLSISNMIVKVLSEIAGPWGTIQGHPIMAQMGNTGPGRRRCLPKPCCVGRAGLGRSFSPVIILASMPACHFQYVTTRMTSTWADRKSASGHLAGTQKAICSEAAWSHSALLGRSSWITSQGPSYSGIVMSGTSILGGGWRLTPLLSRIHPFVGISQLRRLQALPHRPKEGASQWSPSQRGQTDHHCPCNHPDLLYAMFLFIYYSYCLWSASASKPGTPVRARSLVYFVYWHVPAPRTVPGTA